MIIEQFKAGRELDGHEIEIADDGGTVVDTLNKEVVGAP
jgi:hypothetical protein